MLPDPAPMTVAMLLAEGQLVLRAVTADAARIEAELLLRHVLGQPRAELYANLSEPVAAAQAASYRALLGRRPAGVAGAGAA